MGPGVSDLRFLPLPAFWIVPPYRKLESAHFTSHAPSGAPYAILLLSIEDAARDGPVLAEWVPRLRACLPAHPLALRVHVDSERNALETGRLAAELRLRTVVVDGDEIGGTLRRGLTGPEHVPGDVVAWLRMLVPGLSALTAFVIEPLVGGARTRLHVREVLGPLGVGSERKVRALFRAEHLPPPREWLRLGAATLVALRLQRYPADHSLTRHAHALGYSDRGSLIRQLSSVFGASPRAVRRTLGWEPWLSRWVQRWRRAGYFTNLEWPVRQ